MHPHACTGEQEGWAHGIVADGANPLRCQCLNLSRMQDVKWQAWSFISSWSYPGHLFAGWAHVSTARCKLSLADLMLLGAASFGLVSRTGAALSS